MTLLLSSILHFETPSSSHPTTTFNFLALQSAPVCSGSVSLQDVRNSYMIEPIEFEVTPDNQDDSISFMIPSSRENLNRFYDAIFTLINSAGSVTSNISNISELLHLF